MYELFSRNNIAKVVQKLVLLSAVCLLSGCVLSFWSASDDDALKNGARNTFGEAEYLSSKGGAGALGGKEALGRVNPAYIFWLEKQSILASADEYASKVTGTALAMRYDSALPHADTLAVDHSVWLSLNPSSLLAASSQSSFSILAQQNVWESLQRMGVRGLFLYGTQENAAKWRAQADALSQQAVGLHFATSIGSDDEYAELTRYANAYGALTGDMLLPAATGVGADFFLAARAKKPYVGLYNMIELPTKFWHILPHSGAEWESALVPENVVESLQAQGVLPDAMLRPRDGIDAVKREEELAARDTLAAVVGAFEPAPSKQRENTVSDDCTGVGTGLPSENAIQNNHSCMAFTNITNSIQRLRWAVTSEVRGHDGITRRWLYLCLGAPSRPILQWQSPSAAAKRVYSAALIRSLGLQGTALAGIDAQGFHAEVPSAPRQDLAAPIVQSLAAEARRYGAWTFFTDAVPLYVLQDIFQEGADLALDRYAAPAAAHALLCGNTQLLQESLTALLNAGIDHRRLVHAPLWQDFLDYSLMQFSPRSPARALALEELKKALPPTVFAEHFVENALYGTAAGMAEWAQQHAKQEISVSPALPVSTSSATSSVFPHGDYGQRVQRGHRLLTHWQALFPGFFMLDGRDVAGLLPLKKERLLLTGEAPWLANSPQSTESSAVRSDACSAVATPWERHNAALASARGAYFLRTDEAGELASRQGAPKGQQLYPALSVQMRQEQSFAKELSRVLRVREQLHLADAVLVAVPQCQKRGLAAFLLRLPPQELPSAAGNLDEAQGAGSASARLQSLENARYLLVVANFGQKPVQEELSLALSMIDPEDARRYAPMQALPIFSAVHSVALGAAERAEKKTPHTEHAGGFFNLFEQDYAAELVFSADGTQALPIQLEPWQIKALILE